MNNLKSNSYISTIIVKFITIFVNIITTMIMSRYLGPSLKGELSYINNIIVILTIVFSLGAEQSYGFFIKRGEKNATAKYIKYITIINSIYLCIIIAVNLYFKDLMLIIVSIFLIFNIISAQLTYAVMIENVIKRNKIMLIGNIVYCVIIIFMYIFMSKNIIYPIIMVIIKLSIEIIFYYRYIKLNINNKISIEKAYVLEVFNIGIPAMIMSLLISFNYNIDVIILKQYLEFDEVGLYTAGVAIANLAWIFTDSFKEVLFSKTAKKDAISDIVFAIKINFIILITAIIVFSFMGKFIIMIIHGSQFINSYQVTLILLIGSIPMMFFKLINTIYTNLGRQKKSLLILVVSVISNVIINVFLIPKYGINGAAFASVISYSICGIIFVENFSKEFNVELKEFFIWNKNEIFKIKSVFRRNNG